MNRWVAVFCLLALTARTARCANGHALADTGASLPERVTAEDFARLDVDVVPIAGPYGGVVLITRGERNTLDRRYGERYRLAAYGYARQPRSGSAGEFVRRVIVHGQRDMSDLARQTAAILLLLTNEMHVRMRREQPGDDRVPHLWLASHRLTGLLADVAGEQFDNQMYLHAITVRRTPVELLREICHEYGHYALPGISGYRAPENWSNGILGERLFASWLAADTTQGRIPAAALAPCDVGALRDFVARRVDPLVCTVAERGVDRKTIAESTSAGMDAYTALALFLDSVYGSPALASSLAYTDAGPNGFTTATDFIRGMERAFKEAARISISMPAGCAGLSAALVYLPAGRWRVEGGGLQIAAHGRWNPEARAGGMVSADSVGWVRVRVRVGTPATLRRLR